MGRFFKGIIKFFFYSFLFFISLGVLAYLFRPQLPERGILRIQLDGPISESKSPSIASALGEEPELSLSELSTSIVKAAHDPKIKGLVLQIGSPEIGLAQLMEIEHAMATFRQSGKWNIAHLDTTDEVAKGDIAYALAATAEQIWLSPVGDVNMDGLEAQVPFAAETFERLHIKPAFQKRYAYKNSPNTFTEKGFTKEHQEATKALVDDLQNALLMHLAARRNTKESTVQQWITTPHPAELAKQQGLVDVLAYWDQVLKEAQKRVDMPEPFIEIETYAALSPHEEGEKIALIIGTGAVVRGKSHSGPVSESTMGSETLTEAFRDARKAKVKGVLFRVDSPGGSYIASDLIRRELILTKEAGIPVVVSMGNLAASGGYFVAMDANSIIAELTTITGSIGVYSGTFAVRDFFDHFLGLKFESYQAIQNPARITFLDPPSKEAEERMSKSLDRIYQDFVGKAAKARNQSFEQLHSVAQGRVWSGQAALKHGLVDGLGGMDTALLKLKELAHLKKDAAITLEDFPKPQGPLEMLREVMGGSQATLLKTLQHTKHTVEQQLYNPQDSALRTPDIWIN